jgi:hypothetical protein
MIRQARGEGLAIDAVVDKLVLPKTILYGPRHKSRASLEHPELQVANDVACSQILRPRMTKALRYDVEVSGFP